MFKCIDSDGDVGGGGWAEDNEAAVEEDWHAKRAGGPLVA